MENQNQIQIYDKMNDPMDAITKLGKMLASSGLAGCSSEQQGQVLAWEALAQRKAPTQLLREYHIIENRLSDRAESMMAKFLAAGGKRKDIVRTTEDASITLTSKDGITMVFKTTWAEMQKEPFVWMADGKTLKKNWRTPRARMQTMWARVISDGVRTLAPDIVSGIYTPEEVEDEMVADRATALILDKPANPVVTEAIQSATPATPKKEKPKKDQVIDVQSEKVVEKPAEPVQEVQEVKEVVQPPPATPKVEPTAPAPQITTGNLSGELIRQVTAIIGDSNEKAIKWLVSNNWIRSGQGIADLPETRAKRIVNQKDSFLKTIQNS